jgi:dipeptidyl aminopeptidase/acylaminoacyl peptidase
MRLLVAMTAALAALSLTAADTSRGGFPASKGRLLILSEDFAFAVPSLVRDNGDLVPVGLPLGIHGSAAVSPDGTRIAMVDTVPLFPGLTVPALLTGSLLGEAGEQLSAGTVTGRPSWSPDGTKVAYAGKRAGNWGIYVIAATEGALPVGLTASSAAADTEPRWSPDGTRIAFDSDRSGNVDVYTMNSDGSGVTNLTGNAARDTLGDWSPDSKQLVFSSTRSGNGDLYVTGANGISTTRLTSDSGADTHPAWSPDGATIAYSNDEDGDNEVYEVAPNGAGARKLTDNVHEDLVQDWQPLRDATPPRIHALKSTGRRGRQPRFRFTISEDSRIASVQVDYSYRTKNGGSSGFAVQTFEDLRAGHVYSLVFPGGPSSAPAAFRFCLTATDPSVNEGKRSCAWFRFLPKKKRR